MGRETNIEKLRQFRERLSHHIPIQKMILFGSRATGRATRYSDFDILLVSPAFRRRKSITRPLGLHYYWNLNYPVDFLCYTPEEFTKLSRKLTLVRQVLKEGIEIKAK